MVSSSSQLASRCIVWYIRHFPLQRGKWKLLHSCAGFLVVELEAGLIIRIADPTDVSERYVVFGYEQQEMKEFMSLAKPGMTFFDVGANLGMYSVLAGKRVGPSGRVHAFEPTPALVSKLKQQLALNSLHNVTVNETAISSETGTAQFFLAEASVNNCLSSSSDSDRAIFVRTITLDEYVHKQGIAHVDLMKVDVEGAEVQVLLGAKKLLSASDAPTIMMEVCSSPLLARKANSEGSLELLSSYGYQISTLAEHAGYRNVLATKARAADRSAAA